MQSRGGFYAVFEGFCFSSRVSFSVMFSAIFNKFLFH